MKEFYLESLNEPAFTVMKDVCGVKSGERVLIITNPDKFFNNISLDNFAQVSKIGLVFIYLRLLFIKKECKQNKNQGYYCFQRYHMCHSFRKIHIKRCRKLYGKEQKTQ